MPEFEKPKDLSLISRFMIIDCKAKKKLYYYAKHALLGDRLSVLCF